MGKPKWWVCSGCKSLNDIPAAKCYKCRAAKPADATLIDDQYSEVSSGTPRVGISVDLAMVGDLIRPDPLETAKGGELMEAFGEPGEQPGGPPDEWSRPPLRDDGGGPRDDGGGPDWSKPPVQPTSRLREPTQRSISEVGERPWAGDPAPGPTGPASPAPTPGAQGRPPTPSGSASWPPPPRRPDQEIEE